MHEMLCLETVCIVRVELCLWVIEAIFFVCFVKVPWYARCYWLPCAASVL